MLVSAARAPDVSMLTPSFSLEPSFSLVFDLDDRDLVLLLDLELPDLPRGDLDLELSDDVDDSDLERENFPLLFLPRSLFLDLDLLRDLLLEESLLDLLLELLDLDLV